MTGLRFSSQVHKSSASAISLTLNASDSGLNKLISAPSSVERCLSVAPATNSKTRDPWHRMVTKAKRTSLTVEAMALLAAAGWAQRNVSMPKWSRVLGEPGAVPKHMLGRAMPTLPPTAATPIERRVGAAVLRASRKLPWQPTCLAEATAAQVLLRQFGSAGVVVIGLRRGVTWEAHAWLLGVRGALTGGPAAAGFTPTSVFEVPGKLRADQVQLPMVAKQVDVQDDQREVAPQLGQEHSG